MDLTLLSNPLNLREHKLGELAADFIEQEVGRHDWLANWRVLKTSKRAESLARKFIEHNGHTEFTTSDLIAAVDALVARKGRWS